MPAVPPQSLAMERAARPTVPSPFILRSMLLTGLLRLLQCHEVLNGLHLSAPVAGFGEGARTAGGQAMAPRSCFRRARPKRWRINHRYARSEEHTSELQSLMRTSYAVFCLKKK